MNVSVEGNERKEETEEENQQTFKECGLKPFSLVGLIVGVGAKKKNQIWAEFNSKEIIII